MSANNHDLLTGIANHLSVLADKLDLLAGDVRRFETKDDRESRNAFLIIAKLEAEAEGLRIVNKNIHTTVRRG